ncbi:hypothetical protein PAXINDRAFT_101685 [Paxillus involutus ATCC 200175]|uniref:Uncharacterized protein n=1 Tax=Paxillus involutus ATCC 200175 TaxID=664439 RepID=A0A0C9TVX5_PAXIN|nr:hypothetical protein PAXINDRAFT_101685 [Paxillus involutus ATCC 200175]
MVSLPTWRLAPSTPIWCTRGSSTRPSENSCIATSATPAIHMEGEATEVLESKPRRMVWTRSWTMTRSARQQSSSRVKKVKDSTIRYQHAYELQLQEQHLRHQLIKGRSSRCPKTCPSYSLCCTPYLIFWRSAQATRRTLRPMVALFPSRPTDASESKAGEDGERVPSLPPTRSLTITRQHQLE